MTQLKWNDSKILTRFSFQNQTVMHSSLKPQHAGKGDNHSSNPDQNKKQVKWYKWKKWGKLLWIVEMKYQGGKKIKKLIKTIFPFFFSHQSSL